jgi:hypothetical protein
MPIIFERAAMDEANRTLSQLADKDRWLGELAQRVSAGGMKLVADEFKTSTDPYGKAWAPLKRERKRDRRARLRAIKAGKTPRGMKILVRNAIMKGSVGASPQGRTARVVVPTWYARFHQEGTVHMAQRMILPSDERGLPDRWDGMIKRESQLFMSQRFGIR